jgi:putative phage-type endonuclease
MDAIEDVTERLIFEENPFFFDEKMSVEFVENALQLLDEFVTLNPELISNPDFYEILFEEIQNIFSIQLEDIELHLFYENREDVENEMNELLEDVVQIFITLFYPENRIETEERNVEFLERRIQYLRDIPQPVQRTPEWYLFRSNLITASNAWKAFETECAINQLIYEKCQPLQIPNANREDIKIVNTVNTNTPMHHGQKYEPLSVMLYESMYNTKIEDFGCIQHSTYKFLGASPDGINVCKSSKLYGRMLEIKNPVSRTITGTPKKEYWVQMQLQMEVCDLNECDFLETKFVEYENRMSYKNDTSYDNELIKCKGIIIQFYTREGIPFYAYKPLHLKSENEISQWEDETVTFYESEPHQYSFTKYIYWKLEQLSCILVLRDREWFQNNIGKLEKVWKTIEEERVTGYEHRAPNKRVVNLKPSIEKCEGSSLFNFIKNKQKS